MKAKKQDQVMADTSLNRIKATLRMLLTFSPNNLTTQKLNGDFRGLEGYLIPYQKLGYQDLDSFLRMLTDTLRVNKCFFLFCVNNFIY